MQVILNGITKNTDILDKLLGHVSWSGISDRHGAADVSGLFTL